MARPYSQDLRDRVIEATGNGTSARQAAVRFDVGVSTAIKWVERLRDSGERSARRQGRRPGSKLDAHRDFLLAVIEAAPDATIEELQRRLVEEKGVRASTGTIWTFLDRCGLTFKKKSLHAAEQDRPDVVERREDWFEAQLDLDPAKLVFVDESFASTNMARLYGRAPTHQHGSPVRPRAERSAPARGGPARAPQEDHARCRAAAERRDRHPTPSTAPSMARASWST
jgi:transposase